MQYKELYEHGIRQEESNIRIHICPRIMRAYTFPTQNGIDAIDTGLYPERLAFQDGITYPTARGYCIPPEDIKECEVHIIPNCIWEKYEFKNSDSCKKKGRMSALLTETMLKLGLIRFPIIPQEIIDKDTQIKGIDMINVANYKIQVKCDYKGGLKELGGTGNLFLQTHELNPLNIH